MNRLLISVSVMTVALWGVADAAPRLGAKGWNASSGAAKSAPESRPEAQAFLSWLQAKLGLAVPPAAATSVVASDAPAAPAAGSPARPAKDEDCKAPKDETKPKQRDLKHGAGPEPIHFAF
jgi:hypothetical protein